MPKLERPESGHETGREPTVTGGRRTDEPTITGRETATDSRPNANRAPIADIQRDDRPDTAPTEDEHEGATEKDISDRTGPGVGYDQEPEREHDRGGVAES